MEPFFTLGHSTRPLQEFIGLLQDSAVARVVDVRRLPGSRRHPHFDQERLRPALAAQGIDYLHVPALGGRRGGSLAGSPNGFWTNLSFRRYADYALTAPFQEALAGLIASGSHRRSALVCSEAVWWRCHRRIIADYLLLRGCTVWHILGPGQVHQAGMTPSARATPDGAGLWYPPPA